MKNFIIFVILSVIKFLNLLGWNLKKTCDLRFLFKYMTSLIKYLKLGGKIDKYHIVLSDFTDYAGQASGHYFHQDLLVAKYINERNPKRHIDFGSRIDGFVAHLASFREVEILDIRPVTIQGHSEIKFLQCDLMSTVDLPKADSVSCLHTLEHLGLGRYGDPIDPEGHIKGLENLINLLETDGTFYLSVPLSSGTRVHFNAHRVFDVTSILKIECVAQNLKLENFDYVDDNGNLIANVSTDDVPQHYIMVSAFLLL